MSELFKLRPMLVGDVAYVVSTWVQSLTPPHWMARPAYLTNMRRSAAMTIERSRVVVLASADHESTIMGWACGSDGVVHHAYVRPALRKAGAGKEWTDRLIEEVRRG